MRGGGADMERQIAGGIERGIEGAYGLEREQTREGDDGEDDE